MDWKQNETLVSESKNSEFKEFRRSMCIEDQFINLHSKKDHGKTMHDLLDHFEGRPKCLKISNPNFN
jgi:hypothetical protein